jgi:hypothetical protein
MRVQLTLGGTSPPREAYLNLDPLATPGDGRVPCSFADLSEFLDDAEASEIVALDVVDRLMTTDADATLIHWVSKLARGGTLAIGGLDLAELSRRCWSRQMSLELANSLLYGGHPRACRRSARSLSWAAEKLISLGIKPLTKTFDGVFYCVNGVRP